MKDKIKQWVIPRLNTIMSSLEYKECSEYADAFSEIVSDCIEGLGLSNEWVSVEAKKLEWTLMTDAEPEGIFDHVDCYIVLKCSPYDIIERPWNTHHKCFDDSDYDDFQYSPEVVLCWIIKPNIELPLPPKESGE